MQLTQRVRIVGGHVGEVRGILHCEPRKKIDVLLDNGVMVRSVPVDDVLQVLSEPRPDLFRIAAVRSRPQAEGPTPAQRSFFTRAARALLT